jgi:hypothetical protein
VCLLGSFVGLLEAARVLVGVICWTVGGGNCACVGHVTADNLSVALS